MIYTTFRLGELLHEFKKEFPKDKRLHKEIKKIREETFRLESALRDVRAEFKKNDITRETSIYYLNNTPKSFSKAYNFAARKAMDEAENELLNAEKEIIFCFSVTINKIKKYAEKKKVNINKELKSISAEKDYKKAAKKLVKLIDNFELSGTWRFR